MSPETHERRLPPEVYSYRYAALAIIDGADGLPRTPAEYADASPFDQALSTAALTAAGVALMDRLRAVSAVSEWTAEIHARTVADVEAMLTAGAGA